MATINVLPGALTPINACNSSFIANNGDMFDGDPTSDVINLKDHDGVLFVINCGTGATGTAKITAESCDDVTPTTATDIAFYYRANTVADTWGAWTLATAGTGFTTAAQADKCYQVLIQGDLLGGGTDHRVRLQMTEVANAAVHGGVVAYMVGPKYAQEVPATVLT